MFLIMSDNLRLNRLLIDFLEYLEVERQLSGFTIRNYHHYLRRFIDWYISSYKDDAPKSISIDRISNFEYGFYSGASKVINDFTISGAVTNSTK